MRLIIFLLLIGMGCSDRPAIQTMEVSKLNPGPIRHDSLSEAQLSAIKGVHETFAEVHAGTLEETIDDFKRDEHPDNEIAIWQQMAEAYKRFLSRHPGMDKDTKMEVYQVVVLRSMMNDEEVLKQAQVARLQDAELKELLSYYHPAPVPVKVITK